MRRESAFALAVILAASVAAGQEAGSPTSQSADAPPSAGSKPLGGPAQSSARPIRPPILVSQINPEYPYQSQKRKIVGTVLIAFTVDAAGAPRNVHAVKSLDPTLDEKAIQAISAWKFKPAMKQGDEPVAFDLNNVPVSYDLTVEVNFQLIDTQKGQKVGTVSVTPSRPDDPGALLFTAQSHITPPVPIKQVPPVYPKYERKHRISGECALRVMIDADGCRKM